DDPAVRRASALPPDGHYRNRPAARHPVHAASANSRAMRLLRRDRNSRHHESHPMAPFRVHNEHLPVEIKKHIEAWVAPLHVHGYHIKITIVYPNPVSRSMKR